VSVLKSELKQLVTHEIGVRVDDALEGAKREQHALEGRQVAFAEGAKAVEVLLAHVDKDVTEEKYDLATADLIKKYVVRSIQVLQGLAAQGTNLMLAQAGKVQAFAHTVTLLNGMLAAEKANAEKMRAAISAASASPPLESGEAPTEPPRPISIKAQRLAEEAAQEAPKKKGRKPRRAAHS
jgi:hypothetical protein